jgi:uroporphyrin-III C-methyltransferase / precorrin-2 dehydrogenase / sirohydrochlorin ferrochelatase
MDLLFPVALKLRGRPVLLVGGGRVAAQKLGALLAAGADVTVVAPDVSGAIADERVRLRQRRFEPADLDGVWFVVAAATPEVNRDVAAAAEQKRVFVNAVDDPSNASAYLPAVVRRGDVTIAISTGGDAPALAGLLREAIDTVLPDDTARWLDEARRAREQWRANDVPYDARRPLLLEALNSLYKVTS